MTTLLQVTFICALTVTPWLIWFFVVERSRLFELLVVGLLVSLIAFIFDTTGVFNGLWVYHWEVFKHLPAFVPMDLSVLPVGYMVTYQYVPSWSRYIVAAALLSIFGAYVVEPIFTHFHFYEQLNWEHLYSAIIYFSIAILIKVVIHGLKQVKIPSASKVRHDR